MGSFIRKVKILSSFTFGDQINIKMNSPKKSKIKINKAQCKLCQTIIESSDQHDLKMCKCGACGVDGGKDYIKRLGNPNLIIELSEFNK